MRKKSFKTLLKEAKTGNSIVLYQEQEDDYWDYRNWKSHFRGFVAELKNNKLLLNGEILFCQGKWNKWWPCQEGVAVKEGDKITFYDENNRKVLYEGDCEKICFHPDGFVVFNPIKKQYLINGEKEIEWRDLKKWDAWSFHPKGYVVKRGKSITNRERNQFFLNEKKLIYEGYWDSWWSLLKGIGIKIGDEFFACEENEKKLIFQGDCEWRSSPYGVIARKDKQFLLYCA